MGVASSVIEDDRVLLLCQERKRFVREALDGRCALACAHRDYIVSLRDTGSLLRKCFEGEKSPATANEEGHFADSEDGFDNSSTETLGQVYKNPNDVSGDNTLTEQSIAHHVSVSDIVASENIARANKLKGKRRDVITNENDEIPAIPPVNVAPSSAAAHTMDSKEPCPDVRNVVKDLSSCMKEVEILFFRACDSGKQVAMILEEDKIQFRPLLPEEIAHGSKASKFLATFLVCCREEVSIPEPPPQAEMKYLAWHRSVSSQLSPSTNPPGTILDIHTSTLDRLYAWETKLYDEVKASSSICSRYDEKCRQLRDQESRGKKQIITDFTRAAVKDLHSRILVAIQKIDFISMNIEDLRDKELQPQLDELIESAIDANTRSSSHYPAAANETPFNSEPQCQAALLLSIELGKLRLNLQNWIASHRAYLGSLNLWLRKCMKPPRKRKSSRKQNAATVDVSPTECAVAPMFAACEIWMKLLDDLPTDDLEEAIEGLFEGISRHLPRHLDQHLDETLNGETEGVDVPPRDDAAADLRSGLVTFMEKLEAFSKISVQKYLDLQRGVSAAKDRLLKEA